MKTLQGLLLIAVIGAGLGQEDYLYDDFGAEEAAGTEAPAPATVTPPKFDVEEQTFNVTLGEDASIPCTGADESQVTLVEKAPVEDPTNFIMMSMDDMFLVPNAEERYAFAAKTFTIKGVLKTDSALYRCVYQYGQQQRVTLTHRLDVQYPAAMLKPCDSPPCSTTQYVKEGEVTKVQCRASGNPKPKITWTKMETEEVVGTGESVALPEATEVTPGKYLCTAHNGIGEDASVIRDVRLSKAPVVEAVESVVRSGVGAASELQCRVKAEPRESPVTWQREGQDLQVETEATMEGDAHVYTLSLASVTEAELGNYTCTASNDLGTAEADFELTDVPSDPVVNADPSGADFTAFALTWTTETFYPVETVELVYRLVKFNESSEEPGEWMNITKTADDLVEESNEANVRTFKEKFENLEKDSDYEGFISAANSVDKTASIKFNFETLAPAPTTAAPTTTTTAATTRPPQKRVTAKDGSSRKQAKQASFAPIASPTSASLVLSLALAACLAY